MRPLLILTLLSLWITLPAPAQARKSAGPRDGFYFGMKLSEANALVKGSTDYIVAYRVDTASTADIFCRYQDRTLYLAHFLRGVCHSVEKRALVSFDDADKMFTAYFQALGHTDEVAESTDHRSRYAKWRFKDRELALSAYGREDGTYLLIHEEYDPARVGQAILAQQRELAALPQSTDPLTGKPLLESTKAAQQAAENALPGTAPPAGVVSQEWQSALPGAPGQLPADLGPALGTEPAAATPGDDPAPAPLTSASDPPAKVKVKASGKSKPVKAPPPPKVKKEKKVKQQKAKEKPAAPPPADDPPAAAPPAADPPPAAAPKDAVSDPSATPDQPGDKPAPKDKAKPKEKDRPRIHDKNEWG